MNYTGLTENQVIKSREAHGENKLSTHKRKSFFVSFLLGLNDPIIKVLIIALIINIVVMLPNVNWFESGGICATIIIATLVSTISEYSSENAFEKLKGKNDSTPVIVIRDGKSKQIPNQEVVVCDLIMLNAGMLLVADGEIIDGEIYVNESALTGESNEVRKSPKTDNKALLKGSVVTQGSGIMRVTHVGEGTYYGKIARELTEQTRPSPLKHRLTTLARQISKLGYCFAIIIALAYLINVFVIDSGFVWSDILFKLKNIKFLFSKLVNALTLAISIVVVAVPEGLPMMITVVLSSNMKKMMRDNVLVRKLVGIETSGNINLLFTDKTGTLTEGNLKVKEIYNGFCSKVNINKNQSKYENLLTLCATYCNEATIENKKAIGSNATDRAILEYFYKYKQNAQALRTQPFDSDNKYSACVVSYNGKKYTLFKGAPEKLIGAACSIMLPDGALAEATATHKSRLLAHLSSLASDSYRIVALAIKEEDSVELSNITLLGILAIKDKVRKNVPSAIKQITEAGVKVVMITGDNKETARAIAKECGIITKRNEEAIVLDGDDLKAMSDEEIAKILSHVSVIARALPSDKSRLVKIAQTQGYIVGMTGDGVNDAPSLKSADVGFSMGSGTDVAKEASDIVITDNSLLAISRAILYGRTIFESIRKFIVFQLTMNMSAVGISLLGPFINVDSPVTITQMLWVNIIMDTLGALAFACEPSRLEYMREPPKPRDEKIISKSMIKQILSTSLYVLALCVWFLKSNTLKSLLAYKDEKYLLSGFFAMFIFVGVFVCFTSRSTRINILSQISKNKAFILIMLLISVMQMAFIYFGGELFRAVPLKRNDLIAIILISMTVVAFDLVRKLITKLLSTSKKSNRRKTNVKQISTRG